MPSLSPLERGVTVPDEEKMGPPASCPPPASPDPRRDMLRDAAQLVTAARNTVYGEPEDNFRRIGDLMSAYLWGRGLLQRGVFLETWDVAMLCSYIKDGRIMESPEARDHWVDRAGYTACGYHCVMRGKD